MTSVQNTAEHLRSEIRRHDYLYYVVAAPEITDLQYDTLFSKLKKLESAHPELVTPDSPTQRVGDQPVSHLDQVEHRIPMLSIDNTYSVDELKKYEQRVLRLLGNEQTVEWIVELKVDGVAASIVYENGSLVRAVTRGNGRIGDDITHNIRTIADVPLKLRGNQLPEQLEIRGEVYMTNDDLVRLNQRQIDNGEQPYANTRNVTAGAIRLLDPRVCASRNLRMMCHGVGYTEGLRATTHLELLDELREYGLSPTPQVACLPSLNEALSYCDSLIENLHELEFEVDGLVLKVNRFDQRKQLGATSKSPRWLVAYKFEKYEEITQVVSIQVQIGKTGAITPVANLSPIELAGTTVSRASLHNAEEIERKDIRVGDTVVVEKAGKIIPHVVRVEKHERKEGNPSFVFPTLCPACKSTLVKDEGGVYIRCPNVFCPAQIRERIRYFASRNAMDIEGLGDKIVDQLVSQELVRSYGDLYRLTHNQIASLERMGKRSANNLLSSIQKSRERTLAHLLNALSIRHVGQRLAYVLAEHFCSMQALKEATIEDLAQISEVGEIIAESVFSFLHSDFGSNAIRDLGELGVAMQQPTVAKVQESELLAGKTLVVTGTLSELTRDEFNALIKAHGGRASSNVSAKTDFLVAGAKAGSKLAKAQQLGVTVLTENEFKSMVDAPS